MSKLRPGLYEQLVNREVSEEIKMLPDTYMADCSLVDAAEAPSVLGSYVGRLAEEALREIAEGRGDVAGRERDLVNDVVRVLEAHASRVGGQVLGDDESPRQLMAIADTRNGDGLYPRPQTPIATTSLFTGSPVEPQLVTEIKKEIASSDRIDLLVSFIKWNGLRQILRALEEFVDHGGRLRVITTTYMGATDYEAVEALRILPNTQIRISYDAGRARMHAKAYIFVRDTGFTTAYVGSSNISVPALTSGLEWNVKVGSKDQPATLAKIQGTFESYWEDATDFVPYDKSQSNRLREELGRERHHGSEADATPMAYLFDVRPYAFQQAILDQLQAEREVRGHWRNLIVAATGTGKTVISAFDYRNFCRKRPGGVDGTRLLFVAHREEILKQSLACYRGVLRDQNFGDLAVGRYEPERLDHLFVSIQSLNSRHLVERLDAGFYDYVVIDEFHHAAAASYQDLLGYFQPRVLLGLTGTPERLDGRDVTSYFGGRIAAEIRLPEAIDRKLLCPFQYFGVSDLDAADLSKLRWSRGGYEKSDLENLYVYSREVARQRAGLVGQALRRYVRDIDGVRGLGFCVSVKHAEFMADQFNDMDIPSMALSGQTPPQERARAKDLLVSGEVKFIFVVDLYNEGVDIPEINTILFLRPTESLTVFLQQLGRGLRNCAGTDCLTVLDFVGQANRRYDFASKFEALLSSNRHGIRREIEEGFPSVPKGCYIQLERKAMERVLDNVRHAFNSKRTIVERIETFETDTGQTLCLSAFLERYQLDPRAIYKTGCCFGRLCVQAGRWPDFHEALESDLAAAFPRIATIDSRRWLQFLMRLFSTTEACSPEEYEGLSLLERTWVDMLQVTIWRRSFEDHELAERIGGPCAWISAIRASGVLRDELVALLAWDLDHIDFVDEPLVLRGSGKDGSDLECALDLHCRYSRDQVLVGLGYDRPTTSREGVKWLEGIRCDVLFNTLYKSERDYSPTTMYEDYAVSETLFHWQSQSTTSEGSVTGQRYIHHAEGGSHVLLLVREYDRDAYGYTMPLTFLGLVRYVSHEGSRPMSILWRLERPMPARFLGKAQKLIA